MVLILPTINKFSLLLRTSQITIPFEPHVYQLYNGRNNYFRFGVRHLSFRHRPISRSHQLCSLHMGWQNLLLSRWDFSVILSGGQSMCDMSSAVYWILGASGFSAIFVFRNSVGSHVARHAKTDKNLEQIKLYQKRFRVQMIWSKVTGVILPPSLLINLAKSAVPMRVYKGGCSERHIK
jgi:hypothetical protein